MYIELNEVEVKIAKYIAHLREENDKNAGIIDRRITNGNGNLNINGFAGEMAFCKAFNIQPQFKIKPQSGGEDCHLMGSRVDVKTTSNLDSKVMRIPTTKKLGQVDIFACVVGRLPSFNIIGYIKESEALAEEYLSEFNGHPCYCIPHSALTPFKDKSYY